jgi:hypothetical protein
MLPSKVILGVGLVIILVVAIVGGYAAWQYTSKPAATPTPTVTPTPTLTATPTPPLTFGETPIQEQVRDQVMNYTKENYPKTTSFMQNLSWTGGDVTPSGLVGASYYTYLSSGWNVSMWYPIVPDPIYNITADYASGGVSITWRGTWQNGTITEVSYTDNMLTTEAEIRDAAVAYLISNYIETGHLLNNLTWVGGRVNTGLLGSEVYEYNTTDWKMKIQYPVIPNPPCTVTANYSKGDVAVNWSGTIENGIVTEISYSAKNLVAQFTKLDQARESVIAYLKAYRSETVQYISNLVWTGQSTTPSGLVGSSTYLYQTGGWTMEIQYPVVLNPVYTISANFTGRGVVNYVAWTGTWQTGIITETSYYYEPY